MLNFKKYYILKIISILTTVMFIVDTAGYGYTLSNKSSLRVPLMTTTVEGQKRLGKSVAPMLNENDNDAQLQELMAYMAGDELSELEKKHFEDLKNMVEDPTKKFLETEINSHVQEWEDEGSYKNKQEDKIVAKGLKEAFEKIADKLGSIFGISVPEEYGGSGYRHYYTYRIIKMLSYFWPSLAVTAGVNASVTDTINKFGTKEQKEKLLPELGSKGLGAIAITEADAGSDVMNMKTFARKEENSYILDGAKLFITSAGIASTYIVFAVTDKGEGPDHKKKISTFLVNKDTPGFSIGKIEKKLGQKASPTGELVFKDCKIPEEAMLGKPGEGMKILYYMLTGGRIGIASLALGIARAAYDAASEHAKQRKQSGKAIGEFLQIKEKLTDMKFYIDASELLIRYASYLKDQDPNAPQDINAMVTAASMAKWFSAEKGFITTYNALQIHGGSGDMEELPLARYLRDIVVTKIYEGTSEIQQNIIQRHISLFLNSEIGVEKAINSYLKAHPTVNGHEEEIAIIYEAMNKAKEKLREAIEEKRETHHDSDLLVDLIITRLMLFKAIFLANQGNVSQENIEKNLDNALLASKFLRRALNNYEIFAPPEDMLPEEGVLYHTTWIGAVSSMINKNNGGINSPFLSYKKENAVARGESLDEEIKNTEPITLVFDVKKLRNLQDVKFSPYKSVVFDNVQHIKTEGGIPLFQVLTDNSKNEVLVKLKELEQKNPRSAVEIDKAIQILGLPRHDQNLALTEAQTIAKDQPGLIEEIQYLSNLISQLEKGRATSEEIIEGIKKAIISESFDKVEFLKFCRGRDENLEKGIIGTHHYIFKVDKNEYIIITHHNNGQIEYRRRHLISSPHEVETPKEAWAHDVVERIQEIITAANRVLQSDVIDYVWVFGSFADGDWSRDMDDIDIFVKFRDKKYITWETQQLLTGLARRHLFVSEAGYIESMDPYMYYSPVDDSNFLYDERTLFEKGLKQRITNILFMFKVTKSDSATASDKSSENTETEPSKNKITETTTAGKTDLTKIVNNFKDIINSYLEKVEGGKDIRVEYKYNEQKSLFVEEINETFLRGLIDELIKNAIDGAMEYKRKNKYADSGPDIVVDLEVINEAGKSYVDFKIKNIGEINYDKLREKALSEYNDKEEIPESLFTDTFEEQTSRNGIWALQDRFSSKVFGYFAGAFNPKLRVMQARLIQQDIPHNLIRLSEEEIRALPNEVLTKIYGLTSKFQSGDISLGGVGLGLKDLKADIQDYLTDKLSYKQEKDKDVPSVTFSLRLITVSDNTVAEVVNPILAEPYINHDKAVKDMVNPDNKDLVGLYGGAGVDVSNVLYSTNATKIYFVDKVNAPLDKLRYYWQNTWTQEDSRLFDEYSKRKSMRGFGEHPLFHGDNQVREIFLKLFSKLRGLFMIGELKSIGITKNDITSIDEDKNGNVSIKFNWSYDKNSPKKEREIIFITEDITNPSDKLAKLANGKIDFYYQRACLDVPKEYDTFIGKIAAWLKPKGFMITDDYDTSDHKIEPKIDNIELLEPSDDMVKWANEINLLQGHLIEDYDDASVVRHYGWSVSIRQKKDSKSQAPLLSPASVLYVSTKVEKDDDNLIRDTLSLDSQKRTYEWRDDEKVIGQIREGSEVLISLSDPVTKALIGYVLYKPERDKGIYINRIFIIDSPQYRKQGISRSLIKEFQKNFDTIRAWPLSDDARFNPLTDNTPFNPMLGEKFRQMFKDEGFKEDEEHPGNFIWFRPKSEEKVVTEIQRLTTQPAVTADTGGKVEEDKSSGDKPSQPHPTQNLASGKTDKDILVMKERLLKEKDFGLGDLADDDEAVKILVRFKNDPTFLRENAEKALIALDKTIFERYPTLSAFLDTLFTTPPAETADKGHAVPHDNLPMGAIHSKIVTDIKSHIKVFKQQHKDKIILGYKPLPAVKFRNADNKDIYEYDRKNNSIVFYVSKDIGDDDFERLCWLAYGEWFSQNEADHHYIDKYYFEQAAWDPAYVALLEEEYIIPAEVNNKIVLDAATGVGIPGVLIAEKGAKEVASLDASDFMLEEAKKEAEKRGLKNMSFKQGSIFKMPFEDNSFDMVFSSRALIRQPPGLRRIALKEMLRILKPEGKIKLIEFRAVGQAMFKTPSFGWDGEEWLDEIKKAGFMDAKIIAAHRAYTHGVMPVLGGICYIIEAQKPERFPHIGYELENTVSIRGEKKFGNITEAHIIEAMKEAKGIRKNAAKLFNMHENTFPLKVKEFPGLKEKLKREFGTTGKGKYISKPEMIKALRRSGGNLDDAARILKISQEDLFYKSRKSKITSINPEFIEKIREQARLKREIDIEKKRQKIEKNKRVPLAKEALDYNIIRIMGHLNYRVATTSTAQIIKAYLKHVAKMKNIDIEESSTMDTDIISCLLNEIIEMIKNDKMRQVSYREILKILNLDYDVSSISDRLERLKENLGNKNIENSFLGIENEAIEDDKPFFENIKEEDLGIYLKYVSGINKTRITKPILEAYISHVRLMKEIGITKGRTRYENFITRFLELADRKMSAGDYNPILPRDIGPIRRMGRLLSNLDKRSKDFTDPFAFDEREDKVFKNAFLKIGKLDKAPGVSLFIKELSLPEVKLFKEAKYLLDYIERLELGMFNGKTIGELEGLLNAKILDPGNTVTFNKMVKKFKSIRFLNRENDKDVVKLIRLMGIVEETLEEMNKKTESSRYGRFYDQNVQNTLSTEAALRYFDRPEYTQFLFLNQDNMKFYFYPKKYITQEQIKDGQIIILKLKEGKKIAGRRGRPQKLVLILTDKKTRKDLLDKGIEAGIKNAAEKSGEAILAMKENLKRSGLETLAGDDEAVKILVRLKNDPTFLRENAEKALIALDKTIFERYQNLSAFLDTLFTTPPAETADKGHAASQNNLPIPTTEEVVSCIQKALNQLPDGLEIVLYGSFADNRQHSGTNPEFISDLNIGISYKHNESPQETVRTIKDVEMRIKKSFEENSFPLSIEMHQFTAREIMQGKSLHKFFIQQRYIWVITKDTIKKVDLEEAIKPEAITEADINDIESNAKDIFFTGFDAEITEDNFSLILPTLKAAAEKLPGAREAFVIHDDKGNVAQVILGKDLYMMAGKQSVSDKPVSILYEPENNASKAKELSSIISLEDKEFSKVEVDINYKGASELLQKIDALALNHELSVLTKGFDAGNPDGEILKAINDKTQKALGFIYSFIDNNNLGAGLRNTVADVLGNEFEGLRLANKTEQYSEIKPALKTALEQANLFREILQRRRLSNIEKYDKAGGFDISELPETNEMPLFIAKDVLAHPAGFIESWYRYSRPKINILIQDEKEEEGIRRLMELGLAPQDAEILFKEDLLEIKNKEKIMLGFKENIPGELPVDIQQFQFASLGEGELLNWERPFALLLLRLGIGVFNLPESYPFNKIDLENPNTGESIYAIPVGVKASVESSAPAVFPSEKLIHIERLLSISL